MLLAELLRIDFNQLLTFISAPETVKTRARTTLIAVSLFGSKFGQWKDENQLVVVKANRFLKEKGEGCELRAFEVAVLKQFPLLVC